MSLLINSKQLQGILNDGNKEIRGRKMPYQIMLVASHNEFMLLYFGIFNNGNAEVIDKLSFTQNEHSEPQIANGVMQWLIDTLANPNLIQTA